MPEVTLYTTSWCGDCRRTKQRLDEMCVPYREINIEEHPEAVEIVLTHNGGKRRVPTVLIDGAFHAELPDASVFAKA